MTMAPDTRIGPYEITREIGRSGMMKARSGS